MSVNFSSRSITYTPSILEQIHCNREYTRQIPHSPTIPETQQSHNITMPRGFDDIINTLLGREDSDRGRPRHRFHSYGSHHDPVYMLGGLHPTDDIGDHGRNRGGLRRNRHHGGWDLHDRWYCGGVSSATRDNVRDSLSGMLDGGSRPSRFPSYSMRDPERDWYYHGPTYRFAEYHQGWYESHGSGGYGGYWW